MRKKTDFLIEEVLYQLQAFEESTKKLVKLSESTKEQHGLLSAKEAEFIYRAVMEDVCRKCPKYRSCFGEKKGSTLEEISRILKKAERETEVEAWMASENFRKNCVYYQPFVEELSWLFRMLRQNYYWKSQMEYMRKALQGQLRAQHLLVKECCRMLSQGEAMEGAEKRKIAFAMLRRGIRFLDGERYVDDGGFLCIHVTVQPLSGYGRIADVAAILSGNYHKNFQSSSVEKRLHVGINRLSFVEEGCFQVLFGSSHCSKIGEKICGDTFSFSRFKNKRATMLLSDGMGAGEHAYDDSKKLMDAFESMIETGIREEIALNILHNTLLYQCKQELATLDAAVISMQTGVVKILKAGGAATFVRHEKSVERVLPGSMPPGCMAEQLFDSYHKKLYDGDMVIMVSDGMLDFENQSDVSLRMEDCIEKITTRNAQAFARKLMEMVPIPENGHDDDRTVLVAVLWERKKGSAEWEKEQNIR